MTGAARRKRGPLEEHLTVRIDRDLAEELDAEQGIRESRAGFPISRAELVRYLIRVGLRTVQGDRREP